MKSFTLNVTQKWRMPLGHPRLASNLSFHLYCSTGPVTHEVLLIDIAHASP